MEQEREQAGVGFWLLLAVVCLTFSGVFSSGAPCGRWKNEVFGVPLWMENDPSGSYIASAHELYLSDEGPLFPGHPGTTLQLLLLGVQRTYDAVANDQALTFTEFTARNIAQVTVLSKLLATVLHLVSFYLVFRFARALLGGASRKNGAVLATLGYATCFPVLYYLSRVSVEPLMVIAFTGTFLAIWSSKTAAESGRLGPGSAWAAVAGFAAVSGLVTKLHFFGPMPLFALVYLLVQVPPGRRLRSAGAYALAAGASLVLYSTALDWGELFELWTRVGQVVESATRSATLIPGLTPGGLFPLTELLFLGLACFGLVRFFRRHPEQRGRLLWAGAYAGYALLIWGYRVVARGFDFRCFHYLFLVLVFLAPFFGYGVSVLVQRLRLPRVAGIVLVLLIHGIGLWSAVNTRRFDVEQHRVLAEVHALTPTLAPGERVILLNPDGRKLFRRMLKGLDPGGSNIHGLSVRYAPDERGSRLIEAYAELFPRQPDGPDGPDGDVPSDARRGILGAFGEYVVITDE